MASTKFDLDKFTRGNDFNMWIIKMKALMVHQGISAAISKDEIAKIEDKKILSNIQAKAHSSLILSLGDEVIREVSDEAKNIGIWEKLDSIYMKKSLTNRLYLKKKLYTLQMEESKELKKHLDDYNRIMLDLNVAGVKLDEEDQDIILLSSLPRVYEHFVDTTLYGKQTLTVTEINSTLNSEELQRKYEVASEVSGEGINV